MRKTLLLTYRDVEALFSPEMVLEAVEQAFREKGLGKTVMPPKTYVHLTEYNGDFRVMPAYMRESGAAGVKIVNVHPNNIGRGLRTVMAVIELIDPITGFPLSLMDGTMITAWRTGAAGGVASKYLARRDSRRLGIIGAGVQGRMQAIFTTKALDTIEEILVWDIREEALDSYKKDMEEQLGIRVVPKNTPREVAENSDIIVTCTPARHPIIRGEWVKSGVHINAIGADAPGKRELETSVLFRADKIIVDDYEQASHSGEINIPLAKGEITAESIYGEIGEIVAGLKPGRTGDGEITIFDSTGLAIQDIAVANIIYKQALERGLGTAIDIVRS